MQVRKVAGEGMPLPDTPSLHGDLFVKYIVDLPRELTPSQQEAIAQTFNE